MWESIGPMFACACVFGIPIVAIITKHQRKMLEMRLQMENRGDSSVRAELEALRQEVQSLRNTSMQYDLSFDTALQRMESRMDSFERRSQSAQSEDVHLMRAGR